MISITVLVIAYFYFNPFLEFSTQGNPDEFNHTLNVTTYNVRLFNAYEEKPSNNIASVISELIEKQNPDILCIQEYYREHDADFSSFPYQYIHFKGKGKLGHAIFSKYPLYNSSAFDFDDTYNNTLISDVIIEKDTIRLYNLHLQSFGILPTVDYLNEGNKERIRERVSKAFVDQESQIVEILKHKERSPYPVIICGDFNNTSFSYVYRKLKSGMNDSFLDRGNGLGTTFKFLAYPFRIDYILSSSHFETVSFETIKTTFSDHYPVSASLGWEDSK